jgi:hypothetical protein
MCPTLNPLHRTRPLTLIKSPWLIRSRFVVLINRLLTDIHWLVIIMLLFSNLIIDRIHLPCICWLIVISSLKLQEILTLRPSRKSFTINHILLEVLIIFVLILLEICYFVILRHIKGRFVVICSDWRYLIINGTPSFLTLKLICWRVQRLQLTGVANLRKCWHEFWNCSNMQVPSLHLILNVNRSLPRSSFHHRFGLSSTTVLSFLQNILKSLI